MATIQTEIEIARDRSFVWDAIRDVGAIHRRLVPGFVVDCKLEGESRLVTFANGMVVREVIVSVDDETCRHAWSCGSPPLRQAGRKPEKGARHFTPLDAFTPIAVSFLNHFGVDKHESPTLESPIFRRHPGAADDSVRRRWHGA